MNKKNINITAGIIVFIILMAAFHFGIPGKSSWPKERVEVDGGQRIIMGTLNRIIAVATNKETAEKCVEAGFEQLELVDKQMSDHKEDSELSKINRRAFKEEVEANEPVFKVLEKSISYSKKSGGAFDITVGPLVDLFHEAGKKGIKPTQEQITQAKSKVGYEKLLLNKEKRTVRFAVDGMRLDLGAIAKGYAVDKAAEAMQKCGAIGGLANSGGEIRCFGAPPRDEEDWFVGVQDPRDTKNDLGGPYLMVLKLKDASISTSGDYRRFTIIAGEKYNHIINPSAGTPEKEFSSVTIISDNSTDADALATAVSVMGLEKGLAMIKAEPQTEAILITAGPEYKVIKSSGADKYIQK
jgi:FAD:protein FMN transferase